MASKPLNVFFYGGLGMGGFTYVDNLFHNPPQGLEFFYPPRFVSLARYGGVELPADHALPVLEFGLTAAALKFPGLHGFLSSRKLNVHPFKFLGFPPESAKQVDVTLSFMKPLVHRKPWVLAFDHLSGFYGGDLRFPRAARKLLQRALAARSCKALLPMSGFAVEELQRHVVDFEALRHKVTVIPPFPLPSVPEKKFRPADGKPVRFLFVGKSFARKGGFDVLDAFESLAKELKDVELLLLGYHGAEHEAALARVAALPPKIRSRVIVQSSVVHRDVGPFFGSADVYVMPSHYECFGHAFTEAMNYSLPVIASDVDAVPEVVDAGKTGLLVEKSDVPQLVEAMRSLALDAALRQRLGRAGKERFERLFSSKPVHRAMKKVLLEAAGKA